LWKPSKPGEPAWPSPCGVAAPGRPGWHIECSAMSMAELLSPFGGGLACDDPEKNVFDIHGGGVDLVFPHHENEIAQSCCAFGVPRMANVWMHNGFLQVEGEKMAKSLGNFVTIRELLTGWKGEPWSGAAVRYAMLGVHYRQPIDWTFERLNEAKATLAAVASYSAVKDFKSSADYELAWRSPASPSDGVLEALNDDLNTPDALSHISSSISRILKLGDTERVQLIHDVRFLGVMEERTRPFLTGVMEIAYAPKDLIKPASLKFRDYRVGRANGDEQFTRSSQAWLEENHFTMVKDGRLEFDTTKNESESRYLENLRQRREDARQRKDWTEADRLRAEANNVGASLRDNKDGTTTPEFKS